MYLVILNKDYELTKLLLENAKINLTEKIEYIDISILFHAIQIGTSYDIIELLLKYINNINEFVKYEDYTYNIKTFVDSLNVDPDIIELLSENGAFL